MRTIPGYLLKNCASVRSITIPNSVTSIGFQAFSGTSITEFRGKYGITSIDDMAFANCRSLKTVTLPGSLQSLGSDAFQNTAISSITIPASLTYSGYIYSPFEDCVNLTNVNFASGMKTIPDYVLRACSNIETVTIPASVTAVGYMAFDGCNYLNTIHFLGTNKQWLTVDKGNYNDPLFYARVTTLKNNTITAHNYMYSYSSKARTFNVGARTLGGALRYTSNKSGVKVDSKGNVTISGKFSGRAKITISTSGNASYGSASKVIYVSVPTKTSVSSIKSRAAGKMTVKWKKNTSITGYQIQYSRKKSFKSKKTATISKKTKVGKTIKGLKKGKRYYVRIRAYKNAADGKHVSDWKSSHIKVK